ncbi:family 2 glycosyl transferase, partial [Streptomyces sp. SID5998]|nr:family 2 glycosyl transferase [Streptomyces sp. SID5998]
RRLRAQAEAAEAAEDGQEHPAAAPPVPQEAPAVPHQHSYGDWDTRAADSDTHTDAGTGAYAETGAAPGYGGYGDGQYGAVPPQQYPADPYGQAYPGGQDGHPAPGGQGDPYQGVPYDPYGYGDQTQQGTYGQPYHQGYEEQPYDPAQHHPHGNGSERPDGSQQ